MIVTPMMLRITGQRERETTQESCLNRVKHLPSLLNTSSYQREKHNFSLQFIGYNYLHCSSQAHGILKSYCLLLYVQKVRGKGDNFTPQILLNPYTILGCVPDTSDTAMNNQTEVPTLCPCATSKLMERHINSKELEMKNTTS